MEVQKYVTIRQAAELRPAFSSSALRDIKFKAFDRTNSRGEVIKGNGSGEAGVWLEVGSKVLIDLDAFDAWLSSKKVTVPSQPVSRRRIAACHAAA